MDVVTLQAAKADAKKRYVALDPHLIGDTRYGSLTGLPMQVPGAQNTYGSAAFFGNTAGFGNAGSGSPVEAFAPFVVHHRYGDAVGGTNANVLKQTQTAYFIGEWYGPTIDDAAETLSSLVSLAATGTPFTQSKAVTGFESDVLVSGGNQVSNPGYLLGQGTRVTMAGTTSHADLAYGAKVDATTIENATGQGTIGVWKAFYDDLYNPATGSVNNSLSMHGLNRIKSDQGFVSNRTNYGASITADLAGSGTLGNKLALLRLAQPAPNNTDTVADGVFVSGSNVMTTATAPTAAWIGRTVSNANVPSAFPGTQVKNYYGPVGGLYYISLNNNATASASVQSVTFAEPDMVGFRVMQGAGGLLNPIEYWATAGTTPAFFVSRVGVVGAQGGYQYVNSSGSILSSLDGNGLTLQDAKNMVFGTTTGTKIGSVGGASGQKIGFYGVAPVVQPLLATGAAHTVDDVITAMQTLGLARQS